MTGADIYRGSRSDFEYGRPLSDGDTFDLGDLRLKILEAPGHTFESISIAVIDTGFEAETAGYPKRLIPLLSAS